METVWRILKDRKQNFRVARQCIAGQLSEENRSRAPEREPGALTQSLRGAGIRLLVWEACLEEVVLKVDC